MSESNGTQPMYRVYENRDTGKKIFFDANKPMSPEQRSSSRFRRRFIPSAHIFYRGLFCTFTYNENAYKTKSTKDISKCFNRLRTNLYRKGVVIDYIWHNDFGEETGREHYHALLGFRDISKMGSRIYNYYINENYMAEKFWKCGFSDVKRVTSTYEAIGYVIKYSSKIHRVVGDSQKSRRYGCSQSMPKTPKSSYKFMGIYAESDVLSTFVRDNLVLENERLVKSNRLWNHLFFSEVSKPEVI